MEGIGSKKHLLLCTGNKSYPVKIQRHHLKCQWHSNLCWIDQMLAINFSVKTVWHFCYLFIKLSDTRKARPRFWSPMNDVNSEAAAGKCPFSEIRKDGTAWIKEQSTLYYPCLTEQYSCSLWKLKEHTLSIMFRTSALW